MRPPRRRPRRGGGVVPRSTLLLLALAVSSLMLLLGGGAAASAAGAAPPAPTSSATPPIYTLGAQLAPQVQAARAAAAAQAAEEDRRLTPEQRAQVERQQKKLDALWDRLPSSIQRPFSWSDPSNIAAVVLSIVVSLTSSVDRQGGASLYVAIFAVLLRFRMRQAVALTSLAVFLGSLAPAAAAFCDPHLTERGVLSLADLPGALVILPAMYYGLSWGVIVNSLLPEWLLTLLVVAILLTSAIELAVATGRLLAARAQMVGLWDRLRCELARSRGEPPPPPLLTAAERRERRREQKAKDAEGRRRERARLADASSLLTAPGGRSSIFSAFRGRSLLLSAESTGGGGGGGAKAAKAAAASPLPAGDDAITADFRANGGDNGGASSSSSSGSGRGTAAKAAKTTAAPAAAPAAAASATADNSRPLSPSEHADRAAALERAKDVARRLRHLRRRAEEAEAIALVYPAFHVPTVRGALDAAAERGMWRGWGAAEGGTGGGAGDTAAFCPESVAAELLAGEGDGREQDVAVVLARLDPVTGADAMLRGGTAGGPAAAEAAAAAAAADPGASPAPLSVPEPNTRQRLTPRKVWRLQNKFELLLLVKVVAFHLATEAIRHHTAKPCTPRFWVMLGGFAAAVTVFLGVVVGSYARRRLWRGPQWLGGREQVIAGRGERARRGDVEGAAAGDEGAAEEKKEDDDHDDKDDKSGGVKKKKPASSDGGCWARFSAWRRGHSPFVPLPADQAITRLDACNATDGYACWTRGRIAALCLLSLPIGVVSSAAGMAGGPVQAQLLLLLKLKPHVVAGTSRVMLCAFTLGTAVAYAVSGNLQVTYGLVFGLTNLVIAPLGLLMFKKMRLPTFAILGLSLAMGVVAVVSLTARRLVPEMSLVAAAMRGHVTLPPDERFTMARFCHGNY